MYIKGPVGKFCPSVPSSSTTIRPNVQQLDISASTTCPLIAILQVSFSTRSVLHDTGQSPKLAEAASISQLAGPSEEMKAKLLTGNSVRSSCFPPREESKGNSCECWSSTLWEQEGS